MRFNIFKKSSGVVVTSVNLKWRGATHALPGMPVAGKSFEVTIPFVYKQQERFEFMASYLKQQKAPSIKISAVTVAEPFKLVSVSPQLPIEAQENQKIEFKVKIEAPDYAYEGPLNISLASDSKEDMAHVEVSKIVLSAGAKKMEVADRHIIMDITKGQIFKQNVHLFGLVEFGTEVKKFEATPPFAIVNSDPKTPYKVDSKTGFLVDLFIQAPQTDYGGQLEIKIS